MTWPLKHWQTAIIALVLVLLAYFAISNQALRHDKEALQKEKQQLSGQLEWQNKTQKAVADIDLQRTQELEDAKSKIADLQRDVATGTASCSSPPHAQPPAPPAWMMQQAPDLLTPLNGIISPSESESK